MKVSVYYTVLKEDVIEVDEKYRQALDDELPSYEYVKLGEGICEDIYRELGCIPNVEICGIADAETGEIMFEL